MKFFDWLFRKKNIKVAETIQNKKIKKSAKKSDDKTDTILVQVPHAPQSQQVNPTSQSNLVLNEEAVKFFIFDEQSEIVGVKDDAPEVYKKAFEKYKSEKR